MIRSTILLGLAAIIFTSSCDQPSQEQAINNSFELAEPAAVGLNADSLALIVPHLQTAIDSQWIAGAVALVSRNGKVAYYDAVGYSDRAKTQKLNKEDIFRMASMTKPITSAAIMQLYEQGKLQLDDPVSKYIPEFANSVVVESLNKEDSSYTTREAARPITVHHLLTHTSGLAYGVFHPIAGPIYPQFGVYEGWTTDSVLLEHNAKTMGSLPLVHDPGAGWTYGVNIDVLGRIVEVVSGQTLADYLRNNIFDPLGMEDTWFYLPDDKANRLIDVWHTPDFDAASAGPLADGSYPVSGAKTLYMGGAGLSATAKDYFLFCDAMRQGGTANGNRILKGETVQLMTQNQIDTLNLGEGTRFGYGFAVHEAAEEWQRAPGSYDWGGFWGTTFWIDPQRDMIVVLLTNSFFNKGEKFQARFEEIVNHALMADTPTAMNN